MKMHFCIPVSQQRPDAMGGRYVVGLGPGADWLYSVYLDGFLFCKVRYSQLHRWNEQLRRVFGNSLPPFPPKHYLAMTAAMAEERRDQLERYLQNVTADPRVMRSDVFTEFLTLVQMHTLNITTKQATLDVFLPNGKSINVEVLTSDTAERVLEVVAQKLGLYPELLGYFGLFLIRCFPEGKLSVVKKLADFELPYTSLQSSEAEDWKIGLRKWYLDPALDSVLMDCRAAGDLLYMQAVQDIEIEWVKPTQVQREELKALQEKENQTEFLERSQEVRHYGYIQLDPCTCNHPEPGCKAVLSIGNNEISCCVTLPDGQTQDIAFQMSGVKCWQVTFLLLEWSVLLLGPEKPSRELSNRESGCRRHSGDSLSFGDDLMPVLGEPEVRKKRGRAGTWREAALPRGGSTSVSIRAPPAAAGEEELLLLPPPPPLLLLLSPLPRAQVSGPGLWAAAGREPVTPALRAPTAAGAGRGSDRLPRGRCWREGPGQA
ncbi:Sorting nexin-31 [Microtus ochrogaster]|uniref:Sorting nexin-31 n=1 Tax=Microtus ochrogaster TaxID=79684 RepID=A0A8J6L3N6_MICOH|nr:Sorting nexin-31 [Microtus ochrogaster]